LIGNIKELASYEKKDYTGPTPSSCYYIGSNYDLSYHRFNWFIDPAEKFIKGSVTSYFKTLQFQVDLISFELYNKMTVDSVILDNRNQVFDLTTADELSVLLDVQLPINHYDSITVYYHGIPGPGTSYEGMVQDLHNGQPIIYTFSEPYYAKEWWPCKNDLSDKIDSIDVFITTPRQFKAASNGILVGQSLEGEFATYHWKHRYPIATYLIAIAVTDYTVYSDYVITGTDSLEIMNFIFPEDLDKIKEATAGVVPVMKLYDELFIPYPYSHEKYGHAQQVAKGAMENQTMTFSGTFNHEILAHELAHHWFGDYITCRSWHEIWLNEGFATYLAGLTYEHMFDGYYWPIWKRNNINYVTSESGGSVYCRDTTSTDRIFSARLSYSKGAMFLHMIRWITGDSCFFAALRNYLNDPELAYSYAHTSDLKQHLEASSGKDLTGFFNDWYYGEGYPVYSIRCNYKEKSLIEVIMNQSQSDPSVDFFELPVPLLFKGEDKDTLIIFDHQYSGQSFIVDPGFHVDSVLFDPEKWIISRNSIVSLSLYGFGDPTKPIIYPDPVLNMLWFRAGDEQVDVIEIYGIDGRLCGKFNIALQPHQSHQLDLSEIKPGLYILKSIHGAKESTLKIIKM
jgi:aminopeptidase N